MRIIFGVFITPRKEFTVHTHVDRQKPVLTEVSRFGADLKVNGRYIPYVLCPNSVEIKDFQKNIKRPDLCVGCLMDQSGEFLYIFDAYTYSFEDVDKAIQDSGSKGGLLPLWLWYPTGIFVDASQKKLLNNFPVKGEAELEKFLRNSPFFYSLVKKRIFHDLHEYVNRSKMAGTKIAFVNGPPTKDELKEILDEKVKYGMHGFDKEGNLKQGHGAIGTGASRWDNKVVKGGKGYIKNPTSEKEFNAFYDLCGDQPYLHGYIDLKNNLFVVNPAKYPRSLFPSTMRWKNGPSGENSMPTMKNMNGVLKLRLFRDSWSLANKEEDSIPETEKMVNNCKYLHMIYGGNV